MNDEIGSGVEVERNGRGHFLPGMSGNAAGRPPGIKDKRTKIRDDLLSPLLPKAVAKISAAIDQGEKWAIELVVSYSLPKPRPIDPDEVQELEERLRDLEQLATRRMK